MPALVRVPAVARPVVGAVPRVRLDVVGALTAANFLDGGVGAVLGLRHSGPAERHGGDTGEDCDPASDGSHLLPPVGGLFQPGKQCGRDSVEVSIGPWS